MSWVRLVVVSHFRPVRISTQGKSHSLGASRKSGTGRRCPCRRCPLLHRGCRRRPSRGLGDWVCRRCPCLRCPPLYRGCRRRLRRDRQRVRQPVELGPYRPAPEAELRHPQAVAELRPPQAVAKLRHSQVELPLSLCMRVASNGWSRLTADCALPRPSVQVHTQHTDTPLALTHHAPVLQKY